jgi:hypothetical protein
VGGSTASGRVESRSSRDDVEALNVSLPRWCQHGAEPNCASRAGRSLRSVTVNGSGDASDRLAQAQGMVSVQVDCTLDEALLLMRARAASSDLSLAYIAEAVLDGSIRFDD